MTPVEAVAALCATVVVVAVFVATAQSVGSDWYLRAGVVALTGHVAFGTLVLPRLPYSWDIGQFHREAVAITGGGLPSDSTTVDSFAAPQSLLYTTFLPDPTLVAVFNGLSAVLVALPAADLARRLYPDLDTTRGTVAAVLFLPLPFVFQTIPMRDALDVLLFVGLLAAAARAYDGQRWPAIVAIPLWGSLSLLRPELGAVSLAGAAAGGAVKLLSETTVRPPTVRGLVALAIAPGMLGLAVIAPRITTESFVMRLQNRAISGGAYLESMTYESGADLFLSAPARALYFQYAPFPLHVTSVFDFVAALMLPILIVLTVAAYRSARECNRDTAVFVLLLTTYVLGVVGYGLIDSNFGTTIRHRIPFTFILCILAAPTLERWANLFLGPISTDTTVDSTPSPERVGD